MSLLYAIQASRNRLDPDAAAYVNAVESADGQFLESGVKTAINNFVKGCKSDGTWGNIGRSCILAGARTLSGILVDLKSATTIATQSNFVSADYNRKTGLVGNGTNKFINSGVAASSLSQNSNHAAINIHTASSGNAYMGIDSSIDYLMSRAGTDFRFRNNNGSGIAISNGGTATGFAGMTRVSSTSVVYRLNSTNSTQDPNPSSTSPTGNIGVFAVWNPGSSAFTSFSTGRLRFYSFGNNIGSSGLANYESRISTLMTDLSAAIP